MRQETIVCAPRRRPRPPAVFSAGMLAVTLVAANAVAQTPPAAPAPSATRAPAAPTTTAPSASFEGLWDTTYGKMRLAVTGAAVRGTYSWAGVSRIHGQLVEGDPGRLSFRYDQPDGEKGSGSYRLSSDGQTFHGEWTTDKGNGGAWSGTRVAPVPGRTWLIVLESHWEGSLSDAEYSYGAMLRSFFSRLPHVQVRHRFVNDVDDLRRFCGEVQWIAEPVVLYLSSHGSPAGMFVGSSSVGADVLAACVADLGNLRLLHFGACAVMKGDVPRQIAQSLPRERRFPISGFTETVDWAGSAIVDFTYMDLVLERGLSPPAAVHETRRMLSFARGPREPTLSQALEWLTESPAALPATGLTLFDPPRDLPD